MPYSPEDDDNIEFPLPGQTDSGKGNFSLTYADKIGGFIIDTNGFESLTGKLLIAMPTLRDPRFTRSVIYLCAHTKQGAMGIVINQKIGSLSYGQLLTQLGIESKKKAKTTDHQDIYLHFGGPVEATRGFILHSTDYTSNDTFKVNNHVALTTTLGIIEDMADGQGPDKTLLALGYAGWGPGQLDRELEENSWLFVDADEELIFSTDTGDQWNYAMRKLGVNPIMLANEAGMA